ncbi:hypothetical protein BU23DRAFT_558434 [Bimuria novae-zelandiae CBS 107.79]|uniref:Mediator of RNA polymerase II transcription subunit 21 n=1 Tax=Bimuria novae-zelandiae CBS 107.79 TaxID=1447943 RepID=A0A6A5UX53_9PLEO|nr:hypothetical protein BU23DRAFT_558434 [Bimuria novae-zelandiae CBS 107.79]
MGDILTQIQDELDMLLHQMQSSFAYIRLQAPPSVPPGQPALTAHAEFEYKAQVERNPQNPPAAPPPIASPEQYRKDIAELSRDMVVKERQIELLIANLPGLENSEEEQVQRMKELEKELEALEGERLKALEDKERLVKMVEEKIIKAGKVGSG